MYAHNQPDELTLITAILPFLFLCGSHKSALLLLFSVVYLFLFVFRWKKSKMNLNFYQHEDEDTAKLIVKIMIFSSNNFFAIWKSIKHFLSQGPFRLLEKIICQLNKKLNVKMV